MMNALKTGNGKAETGEAIPPRGARDKALSALRSPLSGFTLLELLVVIAIIAILAGLILSTAGFIQKEGARARAKAEVAALEAALESYKADNGDYPAMTNNAGSTTTNLLLVLLPTTAGSKVYFELPNKGMTNSAGYLTDPFGNTYGYRYPGAATNNGTNFFDLWSTAGTTNTNAWIKNW